VGDPFWQWGKVFVCFLSWESLAATEGNKFAVLRRIRKREKMCTNAEGGGGRQGDCANGNAAPPTKASAVSGGSGQIARTWGGGGPTKTIQPAGETKAPKKPEKELS